MNLDPVVHLEEVYKDPLETRVKLDLLENLDFLEEVANLVLMVCPASMEFLESQEKRVSDTPVVQDALDLLVKKGNLVNKEIWDLQVLMAFVVLQDHKESQDEKVDEDDLVSMDFQEKRENPVVPVLVLLVKMDLLENLVKEVHRVSKDLKEKSDTRVTIEQVKRVNPDILEEMVLTVSQVNVVNLALLD